MNVEQDRRVQRLGLAIESIRHFAFDVRTVERDFRFTTLDYIGSNDA